MNCLRLHRARFVLAVTVSLVCGLAVIADAQSPPERTETLKRTINIGRRGLLDLSNLSGRITVTAGSDEVVIEAVKQVRNASDAAVKALMSGVRIDITERSDRVVVRTTYDRRPGRGPGWVTVDYTIRVPTETTVELRSVSGDIELQNLQGEVRIQSVSGDQRLVNIRNLGLARTVSGDIDVTDVDSATEASVTTVNGDVRARNLKTSRLEVRTISGDLELLDLQCDRLEVSSVSGNVHFRGLLAPTGRYDLHSQYGNLTLGLSTGGFDLDAHSYSGNIQTDFPVLVQEVNSGPRVVRQPDDLQRGRGRGRGPRTTLTRTLRGSYERGGAMVEVRTMSGNITITRN
jgi:Putative adhesin